MLSCYMDNCGNSKANTCNQAPTSERDVFIKLKTNVAYRSLAHCFFGDS